jgi:hypothetical protein
MIPGEYRAAEVPPNTPRLADAIEAADAARVRLTVSVLLLVGPLLVVLAQAARLRSAQLAERAEWYRGHLHLDGQVEEAKRIVVDAKGEATHPRPEPPEPTDA